MIVFNQFFFAFHFREFQGFFEIQKKTDWKSAALAIEKFAWTEFIEKNLFSNLIKNHIFYFIHLGSY